MTLTTQSSLRHIVTLFCLSLLCACHPKSAPVPKAVAEPGAAAPRRNMSSKVVEAKTVVEPPKAEDPKLQLDPCAKTQSCQWLKDGCVVNERNDTCEPNTGWCVPGEVGWIGTPKAQVEWMSQWHKRKAQLQLPITTPIEQLLGEETFHKYFSCSSGVFKEEIGYFLKLDDLGALFLTRNSKDQFIAFYVYRGEKYWKLELLDTFIFEDIGLGAANWTLSKVQSRRPMNKTNYEYMVYEIDRDTTHGGDDGEGRTTCCEGMNTYVQFTLVLKDNRPLFHASSYHATSYDEGGREVQCKATYGVGRDRLHVTIEQQKKVSKKSHLLTKSYQASSWCSFD